MFLNIESPLVLKGYCDLICLCKEEKEKDRQFLKLEHLDYLSKILFFLMSVYQIVTTVQLW